MKIKKLTALTLENFQSLRDQVTLPLGDITLLFGPNSSGKSAVFDALSLFQSLFEREFDNVAESLSRWAHRSDGGRAHSPKLKLDCFLPPSRFSGSHELLLTGLPTDFCNELQSSEYMIEICDTGRQLPISVEVSLPNPLVGCNVECLAISIEFDHVFVLSLTEARLVVNLSHPAFDGWKDREAVQASFESNGSIDRASGLASLPGIVMGQDRHFSADFAVDSTLAAFLDPVFTIFFYGVMNLLKKLKPDHVGADRTVPTPTEASFFYPSKNAGGGLLDVISSRFSLSENLRHFSVLAATLLISPKRVPSHIGPVEEQQWADALGALADQLDSDEESQWTNPDFSLVLLNDFLSRHLFFDNGYSVLPEVYTVSGEEGVVGQFIKLRVRDNNGRVHNFNDIGSGISYAVPVLVAALASRLSVVEEPELHLHPALQSELGDVFIECVQLDNTLIIETHSEHLILRLLRRIRETNNGRQKVKELQLSSSQLSVLYFDPQPAGHTKVRALRLAEDGEFIDRWPRGFFTERDGDLFDE